MRTALSSSAASASNLSVLDLLTPVASRIANPQLPIHHCSSGCTALDDLFSGLGWPSSRIVEISGFGSSGRSSLCLSTAVCSVLNKQRVVYIDTSNSVPPSLIRTSFMHAVTSKYSREHGGQRLANLGEVDEATLSSLDNFDLMRVFDYFSLMNALTHVLEHEQHTQLVVIDSLHLILASMDTGSSSTSSSYMASLCVLLKQLTTVHNTTVLFTNTDKPSRLTSLYHRTSSSYDPSSSASGGGGSGGGSGGGGGGGGLPNYFTALLVECVDIHVKLTYHHHRFQPPQQQHSQAAAMALEMMPMVRAEVVKRPPHYNHLPENATFGKQDLYKA